MSIEGGCQCGAIRYRIEGEFMGSGACHCRSCQYSTGGGPNYATTTPILYIYRQAFANYDFGVAAAAGVVFLGIILVLTVAQWFTIGRQEAG